MFYTANIEQLEADMDVVSVRAMSSLRVFAISIQTTK